MINESILKKTFKSLTLYNRSKYTTEMEKLLKNPEIAFNVPTELLLKNGNSATIVKFKIDQAEVVIKRYNMKTVFHALRRAFKRTRAEHSWRHARLLQEKGINTPFPVAMKEKRFGLFRNKAYFIYEYVKGPNAFDYFHNSEVNYDDKSIIAEKIIKMFDTLKSSMISHGDMKATNILIHSNEPYLIDLDSMKTHKNDHRFRRARKKDMNRFMKNWDDLPEISNLFRQLN
ncbi:MAG: hypothetical protein KAR45_02430 [Desulfobacteraceae bacterium]|nr:hypothetical protein [Desulfobacteraceae bacterium]